MFVPHIVYLFVQDDIQIYFDYNKILFWQLLSFFWWQQTPWVCLRPRPSNPAVLPGCKRPCLRTWPDFGPSCGRPKRMSPHGSQETPLGFISLERGCARRTRGDFAASRALVGWLARACAGRWNFPARAKVRSGEIPRTYIWRWRTPSPLFSLLAVVPPPSWETGDDWLRVAAVCTSTGLLCSRLWRSIAEQELCLVPGLRGVGRLLRLWPIYFLYLQICLLYFRICFLYFLVCSVYVDLTPSPRWNRPRIFLLSCVRIRSVMSLMLYLSYFWFGRCMFGWFFFGRCLLGRCMFGWFLFGRCLFGSMHVRLILVWLSICLRNLFVPSRFIMMVDDDVLWLHWEASCWGCSRANFIHCETCMLMPSRAWNHVLFVCACRCNPEWAVSNCVGRLLHWL
jgi:hypothetical protein